MQCANTVYIPNACNVIILAFAVGLTVYACGRYSVLVGMNSFNVDIACTVISTALHALC